MRRDRQRVAIIAFSPIARDARVLRQIRYLAPDYDLVVFGFGAAPPLAEAQPGITYVQLELTQMTAAQKWRHRLLMLAGLAGVQRAYDLVYWLGPIQQQAWRVLAYHPVDAVHVNDVNALPLGWRAAEASRARLVLDLHEYAPLEFEDLWRWRATTGRMYRYLLHAYAARADASITVTSPIAERYRREFGLDPIIVRNIPDLAAPPLPRPANPGRIELIHHGAAIPSRRLETLLEIVRLCDARFHLNLMLVGPAAYIDSLRRAADRIAPGRVTFHDPVPPDEIVARLQRYDIGLCYIPPTNYNYLVSLPNKLFDFVGAGLAVCIGPSPAMAEIVRDYQCGVVASSFAAADVARALSALDGQTIERLRQGSREAARTLQASVEMQKLVGLYANMLGARPERRRGV